MAKAPLILDRFAGGISAGKKEGGQGSYAFGQSINIHEDSASFVALPKTTKDSGSTVTGLIIDQCRVPNGDTYFLDEAKKFYKRTAAGTWSLVATISSGTRGMGLYYWKQTDTIYITTDQTISTYGRISATPTLSDGKYGTVIDQTPAIAGGGSITYPNSANIQGQWKMEESSGNRADSSSNANTLTDNNTVASSTDKKEGSKSADFEASASEYLSRTHAAQVGLGLTTAFTISCWIKPESIVETTLVSKWDSSTQQQYIFWMDATGKLHFNVSSTGVNDFSVTGATTLAAGTWYFVSAVYLPSTHILIAVNGVQDNINTTSIPASLHSGTADFGVGVRMTASPSVFMDGLMDDVIVWNTNVATADLLTLYNSYAAYTVPTSISENAANTFSFTPTIDPQVNVIVNIAAKGAGDWTVTVHDDSNNTVASKTIVNASLSVGAQTFTFDTNWRPIIGATYHFHITSTAGSGQVTAGTLTTTAARMVSPIGPGHPMLDFTDFLAIGNERYLSTYDGGLEAATDSDGTITSSWDWNTLTLPSGYEITSLGRYDEYIVAGAEYRGTTTDDFSNGLLVFWDGTSETFNFFIEVLEGGVQSVLPIKNRLYFVAGLRGEIFAFGGEDYIKVKRLPNTANNKYIKSLFSSATVHRGLPLFGFAYETDSTAFKHGVYGYGAKEVAYPDVLTYDHVISTGTNTGTSVKIGSVKAHGSDLFIAWRDGATYGVDIVNETANPYASASYESRIFDNGNPYLNKQIGVLRADHDPIPTGGSITLHHKINQASSWTDGDADNGGLNTEVGSTETRMHITEEFKDVQGKVTLGSTTTSPKIHALTLDIEFDEDQAEAI